MKDFNYNIHTRRSKVLAGVKSTSDLDAYVQQMRESDQGALRGVLVAGKAGAGKTFFTENYLERCQDSHPVLIARHYQQHQDIPYFGFKYSISDYLIKFYNASGKYELQKFSEALREYLGESVLLLADYI